MTTFYLLPPRTAFHEQFAQFIESWMPDFSWRESVAADLVEILTSYLSHQGDCFLIFREDLPDGIATDESLREFFGASAGDRVIEVHLGAGSGTPTQRFRTLAGMSAA